MYCYTNILLYYYIILLLYYCVTTLLYYHIILLLYDYIIILLYDYIAGEFGRDAERADCSSGGQSKLESTIYDNEDCKLSDKKSDAEMAVPSTKRSSLRVQWPCHLELAADDVWDYFSAYGHVVDLDWLEDDSDKGVEAFFHFRDPLFYSVVISHETSSFLNNMGRFNYYITQTYNYKQGFNCLVPIINPSNQ